MHGDYPTRLVCTGMHTGDEDWSLGMVASATHYQSLALKSGHRAFLWVLFAQAPMKAECDRTCAIALRTRSDAALVTADAGGGRGASLVVGGPTAPGRVTSADDRGILHPRTYLLCTSVSCTRAQSTRKIPGISTSTQENGAFTCAPGSPCCSWQTRPCASFSLARLVMRHA